jgi:CBS domain-containing protein
MECKDIMLSYVYKCRETDTARTCAAIMRDQKIGFVPVVDKNDKPVGVITDRDLVVRLLACDKSTFTPVRELMTVGELLTCRADEDLRSLEAKMSKAKKSRALVVDREGKCIGVISLSDIAHSEDPAWAGRLLNAIAHRESIQIAKR